MLGKVLGYKRTNNESERMMSTKPPVDFAAHVSLGTSVDIVRNGMLVLHSVVQDAEDDPEQRVGDYLGQLKGILSSLAGGLGRIESITVRTLQLYVEEWQRTEAEAAAAWDELQRLKALDDKHLGGEGVGETSLRAAFDRWETAKAQRKKAYVETDAVYQILTDTRLPSERNCNVPSVTVAANRSPELF